MIEQYNTPEQLDARAREVGQEAIDQAPQQWLVGKRGVTVIYHPAA